MENCNHQFYYHTKPTKDQPVRLTFCGNVAENISCMGIGVSRYSGAPYYDDASKRWIGFERANGRERALKRAFEEPIAIVQLSGRDKSSARKYFLDTCRILAPHVIAHNKLVHGDAVSRPFDNTETVFTSQI